MALSIDERLADYVSQKQTQPTPDIEQPASTIDERLASFANRKPEPDRGIVALPTPPPGNEKYTDIVADEFREGLTRGQTGISEGMDILSDAPWWNVKEQGLGVATIGAGYGVGAFQMGLALLTGAGVKAYDFGEYLIGDEIKEGYEGLKAKAEKVAKENPKTTEFLKNTIDPFPQARRAITNEAIDQVVEYVEENPRESKVLAQFAELGLNFYGLKAFQPSAKKLTKKKADAMIKGLLAQNTNVKAAQSAFAKARRQRTVDGKKEWVTPIDTFVEHEIPPRVENGYIQMGDLTLKDGELGRLSNIRAGIEDRVNSTLRGLNVSLPLDELRDITKRHVTDDLEIKRSSLLTRKEELAKIDAIFDDYEESYGFAVPIDELNEIRRQANRDRRHGVKQISDSVGDAAREVIYRESPASQKLLEESAIINAAIDYAMAINGQSVRGGGLNQWFIRQAGAMIGGASKLPFVGPVMGLLGGDAAAKAIQNMQFKSIWAEIQSGLTPDVVRGVIVGSSDYNNTLEDALGAPSLHKTFQGEIPSQ